MKLRGFFAIAVATLALTGCNISDDEPSADGVGEGPCSSGRLVCSNHGECSEDGDTFACACDDGYTGDTCDTCDAGYTASSESPLECTAADACADGAALCNNHGECVSEGTSYTCECDEGFAGDACDTCADGFYNTSPDGLECTAYATCEVLDCANGTCVENDGANATCSCNEGYTGSACDTCDTGYIAALDASGACILDLCADDPCSGIEDATGACSMSDNTTYACECNDGYAWDADAEAPCVPQCMDEDGDGYGDGPACDGADCLENNANVWGPAQTTILAAGLADGSDEVLVDRSGSVSVKVDYLFTRDQNCPTCTTKLMAAYYSDDTNYIPVPTCVAAETAPLACEAGGNAGTVTVDLPVPNYGGNYELRLHAFSSPAADCSDAAEMLRRRPQNDLGTTIARVETELMTCTNGSHYLDAVQFDGTSNRRFNAYPGQVIPFSARYSLAQGCGGGSGSCVTPLVVGRTGERLACISETVPTGCSSTGTYTSSGSYSGSITAPSTPGIYQLSTKTGWVYNCTDIGFGSTSAFNTFAVLVVQ